MTKLTALIAVLVAWFTVYLGGAFILLEMNPFKWEQGQRLVLVYVGIVASWLIGGIPYVLWKNKQ